MDVEARFPLESDILDLLEHLSDEDRKELLIQGVDPEWAIRHSVETSVECAAVLHQGRLACITGVFFEDGLSPQAAPWLLGTPVMQGYPRLVMKYSRDLITRWLAKYGTLTNFVDSRHIRAIAWLRHLGAEFESLPEFGPYKKPFYKFSIRGDSCASL